MKMPPVPAARRPIALFMLAQVLFESGHDARRELDEEEIAATSDID